MSKFNKAFDNNIAQKKFVFVLNAPPSSGKDAIANMVIDLNNFILRKSFGNALIEKSLHYINCQSSKYITRELWDQFYTRELKEKEHEYFLGYSPRGLIKHTAENVFKPMYGDDIFGKIVAHEILNSDSQVAIITDGGFNSEIAPLVEAGFDVTIIKILRDGCNFDNDTRKWLDTDLIPENKYFTIENIDGNIDIAVEKVISIIQKTVEEN